MVNDLTAAGAEQTCQAIRASDGVAEAHTGSVADWTAAEDLIRACVDRYGSLDGLVNNAGVGRVCAPWDEDEAGARKVIETNLLGTLFCGVHAIRQMIEQTSGSIINIASGAATGHPTVATYGASKGGVLSLTYGWDVDLKGTGVRVNAVMPRAQTAMNPGDTSAGGSSPGGIDADVQPEVIAPLIAYLISDRSLAVSGQVIRHEGRMVTVVRRPSWEPGAEVGPETTLGEMAHIVDGLLTTTT